jgi:GNAT superfamily N-acetyltransferase
VAKDVQQFDPALDQYEAMHQAGKLIVLLLLEAERIVGYSVAILYTPLHWRRVCACHGDVFYIDPTFRGRTAGLRLKKRTEQVARERGAKFMFWHGKPETPFARLMGKTCDAVQDITWIVRL